MEKRLPVFFIINIFLHSTHGQGGVGKYSVHEKYFEGINKKSCHQTCGKTRYYPWCEEIFKWQGVLKYSYYGILTPLVMSWDWVDLSTEYWTYYGRGFFYFFVPIWPFMILGSGWFTYWLREPCCPCNCGGFSILQSLVRKKKSPEIPKVIVPINTTPRNITSEYYERYMESLKDSNSTRILTYIPIRKRSTKNRKTKRRRSVRKSKKV